MSRRTMIRPCVLARGSATSFTPTRAPGTISAVPVSLLASIGVQNCTVFGSPRVDTRRNGLTSVGGPDAAFIPLLK
jgi:hypothetical protein